MDNFEYTHIDKAGGGSVADDKIRELLSTGWEFDESADKQLLAFDSKNPSLEIPAAKYTFKRRKTHGE